MPQRSTPERVTWKPDGRRLQRTLPEHVALQVDRIVTRSSRSSPAAAPENVGTNANTSVFATLICEAAAPFVERNTDAVVAPLAPNGDFRIDDVLSPAPKGCASPVLLIRNAGNRAWFAAGFVKLED